MKLKSRCFDSDGLEPPSVEAILQDYGHIKIEHSEKQNKDEVKITSAFSQLYFECLSDRVSCAGVFARMHL